MSSNNKAKIRLLLSLLARIANYHYVLFASNFRELQKSDWVWAKAGLRKGNNSPTVTVSVFIL